MSRQQAQTFAANGQYDQAVRQFKKALLKKPLDADLWMDLAHCYLETGQFTKACDSFEKVLTWDVQRTEAWFGFAITLEAMKDYTRSFEAYQTVLRLDPTNEPAHQHLGGLYLMTGQYKKALHIFQSLLLKRQSVTSLMGHALALDFLGKAEAACKAYQRVINFNPNTRHRHYIEERVQLLTPQMLAMPRTKVSMVRIK
jgi:tetratricopeptide (TPR) repeat protein